MDMNTGEKAMCWAIVTFLLSLSCLVMAAAYKTIAG